MRRRRPPRTKAAELAETAKRKVLLALTDVYRRAQVNAVLRQQQKDRPSVRRREEE